MISGFVGFEASPIVRVVLGLKLCKICMILDDFKVCRV